MKSHSMSKGLGLLRVFLPSTATDEADELFPCVSGSFEHSRLLNTTLEMGPTYDKRGTSFRLMLEELRPSRHAWNVRQLHLSDSRCINFSWHIFLLLKHLKMKRIAGARNSAEKPFLRLPEHSTTFLDLSWKVSSLHIRYLD